MRAQHDDGNVAASRRRPSAAASLPSRRCRAARGPSGSDRATPSGAIDTACWPSTASSDAIASAFEAARERVAARLVVFDHHDGRRRSSCIHRLTRRSPVRRSSTALSSTSSGRWTMKRATLVRAALDRDRSAHQLAEARHDRESQPGAAVLAGRRHVGLRERARRSSRSAAGVMPTPVSVTVNSTRGRAGDGDAAARRA